MAASIFRSIQELDLTFHFRFHQLKELSLCHKQKLSNPYISAT